MWVAISILKQLLSTTHYYVIHIHTEMIFHCSYEYNYSSCNMCGQHMIIAIINIEQQMKYGKYVNYNHKLQQNNTPANGFV